MQLSGQMKILVRVPGIARCYQPAYTFTPVAYQPDRSSPPETGLKNRLIDSHKSSVHLGGLSGMKAAMLTEAVCRTNRS